MDIVFKDFAETESTIKKQLYGLTLKKRGLDSGIRFRLKYSKYREENLLHVCYVIKNGKVLGWCLVDDFHKDLMIFVRRSCRRKGIGTFLVKRVFEKFGRKTCYKWDHQSTEFYNRMKNTLDVPCKNI